MGRVPARCWDMPGFEFMKVSEGELVNVTKHSSRHTS